jgi:hypothetical protein
VSTLGEGDYIARSWRCSGCRRMVTDDRDMLVELHGVDDTPVCVHVDHMTALAMRMRMGFFGPYCNHECWRLDARPGEQFVDAGDFRFGEASR